MTDTQYIEALKITEHLKDGDYDTKEFARFQGIISTDSLNSYYYRMDISSLRNFRDAANLDGKVPVFFNHKTYNDFQSGTSRSATLRNKQVKATFDILRNLPDTQSNAVIRRMEMGIVNSLSVGHNNARYMCDECGLEMERDWFFLYDQNGHYPGLVIKENGKERVVTATAHDAELREYSVVGAGADPDAKIIKSLKEKLNERSINEKGLIFLSEYHNINYNSLCDQLSFNGFEPKTTIDLGKNAKRGTKKMSNPQEQDLLEKSKEELFEVIDELVTKNDELQEELEKRPTEEEVLNLEKQVSQLTSDLEKEKKESQAKDSLAEQGTKAVLSARESAKDAYATSKGVKRVKLLDDPEYKLEAGKIDEINDLTALQELQTTYFSIARAKRTGGRQSVKVNQTSSDTDEDNFKFRPGIRNL